MLGETGSEDQIQKVNPETVQREGPCGKTKGENLQTWRQAKRLQRRRKRHGWMDAGGTTEARGVARADAGGTSSWVRQSWGTARPPVGDAFWLIHTPITPTSSAP